MKRKSAAKSREELFKEIKAKMLRRLSCVKETMPKMHVENIGGGRHADLDEFMSAEDFFGGV